MAVTWTIEKTVTNEAEKRMNVVGVRTDDATGVVWRSRPLKGIWDTTAKAESALLADWAAMIHKQYAEHLAATAEPAFAADVEVKLSAELQKAEK